MMNQSSPLPKILNREEFLKMPENTLFLKWDGSASEFGIKLGTTFSDFVSHLFFVFTDPEDDGDILFRGGNYSTDSGKKLVGTVADFKFKQTIGRDGMFDEHQHFVVFEKADIEQLIGQLQECLEVLK